MSSIIRPLDDSEIQSEDVTASRRHSMLSFKRLLSTNSSVSSIRLSAFDVSATSPQYKYSLCSPDFFLKIFQLIIAIVCEGLYSNGMRLMQNSLQSMIFPNVVFSAFIIITSVISLSYVLGHVMPPILTRIFNIIGMTLYFVSACVTFLDWYEFARIKDEPEDVTSARILFADACLSLVNVVLYGCDIYLSIKKALTV